MEHKSRRGPLNVLVAESRSGEAEQVIRALRRRGHFVTSCAPPPGSTAPCVGLALEGSCPLDDPVDAVIDVRNEADVDLRTGDLPVVCAMRIGLPVVAVGPATATSCLTWAARRCATDQAVDVCETVALRHRAAVEGRSTAWPGGRSGSRDAQPV